MISRYAFAAASALVLVLPVHRAPAEEALVTLHATVTGNQEQPRVMYIMPWQQPGAQDYEYRPGRGIAEELFRQIDREEFLREIEYRERLGEASARTASTD
jgi:hypothetical protein